MERVADPGHDRLRAPDRRPVTLKTRYFIVKPKNGSLGLVKGQALLLGDRELAALGFEFGLSEDHSRVRKNHAPENLAVCGIWM
jgi:hypothetical protein